MTQQSTDDGREIETITDLDPETKVYHTSHSGGPQRAVHLDPDCRHLDHSKRRQRSKASTLFDDREVCRSCLDDSGSRTPEGTDVQATRKQLSKLDPSDAGLSALGERNLGQGVADDV